MSTAEISALRAEMKSLFESARQDKSIHAEMQSFESHYADHGNKPMQRKGTRGRARHFLAYDLETTRIAEGTPTIKYITAYGEPGGEPFKLSLPIEGENRYAHLCDVLADEMLIPRFNRYRFVAWNGNGFDVFFIAKALLESDDYILHPFLTRSKSLRGLKVKGINVKEGMEWEFLDGMSMTGLDTVKMKLSKFVGLFAPNFPKHVFDFDAMEFDPYNPEHIAYADRDSEALYHAMKRASEIVKGLTGHELQPTMGNLAIKYFQSKMPEGVMVWRPPEELQEVMHGPAKRGGYCWVARQYQGPVWKYDLNQAYAAAMRDAALPCGSCVRTETFKEDHPGVYRVRIAREKHSRIPFYYREADTNAGRFTNGNAVETWLLSTEIEHLWADDWEVKIFEGYYWEETFNMSDMVAELERLRFTDPEGPSGPLGTMVKVIGNSAYGKTLERLGGVDLVMAREQPDGYEIYMPEEKELENVFFKFGETFPRVYHQPQIGSFITAHVRLIVRSAALRDARHFLYADTDCVVFSRPVDFLHIDTRSYGAWKRETDGLDYIIIGKKIYYGADAQHAKGLHIKELSKADFEAWIAGKVPTQRQVQRKNFVKFISGQEMFGAQERSGTDVNRSQQAKLVDGEFVPL